MHVVVVILYFLEHIEDFTTKLNMQKKNYITNRKQRRKMSLRQIIM